MDPANVVDVIDFDVKTIVISSLIVLNIITNSLEIAMITRYPELREDRTALFMVSLSVSDLATGCIVMPISAAVCSRVTPTVKDMANLADLHMYFLWLFSFNSLHSLCWLTLCKMVAVLKPFRYEQLFTRKRCYCVIVFNWVVGAVLEATKFTTRARFSDKLCVYGFTTSDVTSALALFTYAVTVVAPIIVICYATTRIFIVVVRAHSGISAQVHAIDGGTGSAGLVKLRAIRSARNILVICFASVVLTIPLIVFAVMRHSGNKTVMSADYKFVAIWLFSSNTCMNGLLYVVLHRPLRKKTKLLLVELCQLFRCG